MVTSLIKNRPLRIVAFAAGAVAVAGSAAWVTASAAGYNVSLRGPAAQPGQSTTASVSLKTSKASTVCTNFIAHLATDLGSKPDKVDAALQKAIGQTLDDEVKNGDITQQQADAVKKQIAGKAPCDLITAPRLKVPSPGTSAKFKAYQQELLTAAASALGIPAQTLQADLAKGMTLSQIAAAQTPPVTEADFRARLIKNLTPLLDKAVADLQLTSAQEQAIIKQLQTAPIPYWSKPVKRQPMPASGA